MFIYYKTRLKSLSPPADSVQDEGRVPAVEGPRQRLRRSACGGVLL